MLSLAVAISPCLAGAGTILTNPMQRYNRDIGFCIF
jgi:hypothetical protein